MNLTNATFHPLARLPIHEFHLNFMGYFMDKNVFASFTSITELYTDFTSLRALGSLSSPLQLLFLISFTQDFPYILHNRTFQALSKVNQSLTTLCLLSPKLHHIKNDTFMWIPNLVRILFVASNIETLAKWSFRGLKSLQRLNLCNNKLTAVPSDELNVIGSLRIIDLSSNRISSIAEEAFAGLTSLTYLNLENNNQHEFVVYIRYLSLLRNLHHLVIGGFGWFVSVINLNLPVSLPSLQIFQLRNSGSINMDVQINFCSTFPNLRTIVIYDTEIGGFPFSLALHECSLLEQLDLSASITKDINSRNLKHTNISIPTLGELTLARNELESIGQILFIEALNLKSLNISDNRIKTIDSAISHAFKRLIHLCIDGNALVSLSGFEHLTFLKHLNAARNQITEVPLWLISATNAPILITLDLNENPFSCTCKIEKFRKWIVSDTNTWLQPGQYNCASPESLNGISISEVELDCRSFTNLYIEVSIPLIIVFFMMIIFLIRYRWHIKYKLFLLYRHYRPFPENNEDFEMLQLQYHAYIAYNEISEDDAWVFNDLQPNMEEGPEPAHLCIKSRDFIPGHSLIESISENIQQSRKTILVLSPNFVENEWCYHEMEMAKMRLLDENLDVIVLVLLKDIPNNRITLSLRQLLCKKEYLKWPKDKPGQRLFWQRLRQELKAPVQIDRRFCM